jgi:hypothetical protein
VSTIRRVDASSGREPLFGVAATRRIEADGLRDAPAFTLMARAGDAVARLALALAPHAERVLVLAGRATTAATASRPRPSARLRQGRRGRAPRRSGRLARRRRQAHARALQAGVPVSPWPASRDDRRTCHRCPARHRRLASARRRPGGSDRADRRLAARGVPVLAVDVPSGLDPDRGQPLGEACVVASTRWR